MTEQRASSRGAAEAIDHPDVEELYRRCVAVDDKISISTVYRTVKLFEDAGIIEPTIFARAAPVTSRCATPHDHLINLRDGKVIEFTTRKSKSCRRDRPQARLQAGRSPAELYCVRSTTTNPDRVPTGRP